ncbi:hypothetical protein ADICYQ_5563 [Cyclobacterium qasimii M12-11B]|uniref:Uncharacterized protein n=1 Tax=Cyclobacterium qasimii M12-11B TaxID=641524 RepID=S7WF18_9BACT|nr:hypothetical protein ADICYQ_5563 [Cyclobacterium qasimii M12-11B]
MVITTQNGDSNREDIGNDHQSNGKGKFQKLSIDKGKDGR